jgi:D-aminoacyl-tRNA deacylase
VDIGGEVLCVSQFTLLATTKKAAPDMKLSATATEARRLYEAFFAKTRTLYAEDKVKDGVFQAKMDVALVNDGPVGVDYECIDGAVSLHACFCPVSSGPGSTSEGHVHCAL